MTPLLFVVAAGFGAAVRHGVNRSGAGWRATLVVNVVGSFLLGLLIGLGPSADTLTVLGTGLLGSFTTFSMLALEVTEARHPTRAILVGASLVLGIGAAAIGYGVA